MEVAFLEKTQRVGIGWGDEVWWLNGRYPEEAVRLWSGGDGRRTKARRHWTTGGVPESDAPGGH